MQKRAVSQGGREVWGTWTVAFGANDGRGGVGGGWEAEQIETGAGRGHVVGGDGGGGGAVRRQEHVRARGEDAGGDNGRAGVRLGAGRTAHGGRVAGGPYVGRRGAVRSGQGGET